MDFPAFDTAKELIGEQCWIPILDEAVSLAKNLPGNYSGQCSRNAGIESVRTLLEQRLIKGLTDLSQKNGAPVKAILVAAYYILLWKYTSLDNIAGIRLQAGIAFPEFFKAIRENELQVLGAPEYARYKMAQGSAGLDIMTGFLFTPVGIDCVMEYNPRLLAEETVKKLQRHYVQVLQALVSNPQIKLEEIELLSAPEKMQILAEFNCTGREYRKQITIQDLFEEKVREQPDQVAVIFEDRRLTYQELNAKANQLAGFLKSKGAAPGIFVGILAGRSIEMIIGVMGILKAGAAYAPLEPSFPKARLQKILSTINARHVLTDNDQIDLVMSLELPGPGLECVACLEPREQSGVSDGRRLGGVAVYDWTEIETYPADNPQEKPDPNDPAYVIFTSGSTGEPKGVVVNHRPVVNLIDWVNRRFNINPADRLLFITSLCFDLSVYDIFGILAAGGSIRVVSRDDIRSPRLLSILAKEGITFWDSAPANMQQFLPFFPVFKELLKGCQLRLVFLSGDWIPVTMPDILKETFGEITIVSLGGATEATVWSNYYVIDKVEPGWTSIPYGKPIQNSQYFILNPSLEVCPIGVPGDLYIGGDCLSSGYINDPILTREKFIKTPFGDGTIYKTGDIARWWADGNIEFLGRKDFQVKIRGFRIELGEIESRLLKHPLVQDAVVTAWGGNGQSKYLCAYVVSKDQIGEMDLKNWLAGELPEYMIPAYIIRLDSLPVTLNGKVDRKTLPNPQQA
jgi:amino acid adenylation domain-containing protein